MRRRKPIAFLCVGVMMCLVFSCMLSGCGYSTRAYVSKSGFRYIYIEPFVNKVDLTSEFSEGSRFKTYYPLLENVVTNAIVDRFNFDGGLKVSKEPEADVVLRGELIKYGRESINDATDDTPQEYRITIFVKISLYDKRNNKVLWERPNFAGDTTYYTTGAYVTSESQAIKAATEDLARRIVELTVEAW
ncbi:MAG: LptE family protein [Candidatus Omnitrophota bacterium]